MSLRTRRPDQGQAGGWLIDDREPTHSPDESTPHGGQNEPENQDCQAHGDESKDCHALEAIDQSGPLLVRPDRGKEYGKINMPDAGTQPDRRAQQSDDATNDEIAHGVIISERRKPVRSERFGQHNYFSGSPIPSKSSAAELRQ